MSNVTTRTAHVDLSQQTLARMGEEVQPSVFTFSRRLLGGGGAIALIFLTCMALAHLSPSPYLFGFFCISITFWVLGLVSLGFGVFFDSTSGTVRYRASSVVTWISQTPYLNPLMTLGIAMISTLIGVYSVGFVSVATLKNGGVIWGAAPWSSWLLGSVFFGASFFIWRDALRACRSNAGVQLAPDRVGLNLEHRDLFLEWNRITKVTTRTVNRGTENRTRLVSCVQIDADDGRVFYVDIVQLGSDPNVVAALMQFYLERPQDRELLADPEKAIRRFSDAQSQ